MKGRQTWHVSNNSEQKPPSLMGKYGKIMADHPVPPFSTAIQASPSRPWFLDGSDAHWNLEDLASTSQRSPNSDVFWIANRFEQFYEKDAINIYGYLWILWISMDPGTGMWSGSGTPPPGPIGSNLRGSPEPAGHASNFSPTLIGPKSWSFGGRALG